MNLPYSSALSGTSLLDVLRDRRSRRFGLGMTMSDGPLAYRSRHQPVPLNEEDEAALVFAACGITGPALADLCYGPGHGGNIMAGLVGRTVASGDCLQTVALIVQNDSGTWFVRRPQDLGAEELRRIIELNRSGRFLDAYKLLRVKIADGRPHPPMEPIFNINANRWSLHAPGSSYFLPVNDLTWMYLNGLLEILNEDTGVYILDERANFQPAGLGRFARSRGGHLDDNPANGRVISIKNVEQLVTDFVNLEQGMMLQNLGLATQAMGLGGFPHFSNHEFGWQQALSFRAVHLKASRYLGANPLVSLGLTLTGKNTEVPLHIGLERGGQWLLKAMCPPNFASMRDAVLAVVEHKCGPRGVFNRTDEPSSWNDPASVKQGIRKISDKAIEAAIAFVEYVWNRYGRFPAHVPPFRFGLGHQVVHLDAEFYDKFYRPEALPAAQRADFSKLTGSAP